MQLHAAMTPRQPRTIIMRASILFATIAGATAAAPVCASNHAIAVGGGGLIFTPSTLTVSVGDTVTFTNAGGFHNAVADPDAVTQFRCANGCDGDGTGGSGDPSGSSWAAMVAFPTAGSVPYHCEVHGGPGGAGMSGTITVVDDVVFQAAFDG